MGLFRRRAPLHRQLAEAGGLAAGLGMPERHAPAPSQAADPPSWDGQGRGEAGIHGVPRARVWDAVVRANAPGLRGDRVHLVSLADGTLIVEEDEPDGALEPLAEAVERVLPPPYAAEAVRRGNDAWAIGARRIQLVEAPGLHGEEVELVVTQDGEKLMVDGQSALGRTTALKQIGEAQGREYVVRGWRVDGNVWEIEVSAL
jgi:hypothetical protein